MVERRALQRKEGHVQRPREGRNMQCSRSWWTVWLKQVSEWKGDKRKAWGSK